MRGHPWARALWQAQHALQTQNPDLEGLCLLGQAHYALEGLAFVEVLGCDDDRTRRRALRQQAVEMLEAAGCPVKLYANRDIYYVTPDRAENGV